MKSFFSLIFISFLLFAVFCTFKNSDTLKEVFKDKYLIGTALNKDQIEGKDPQSLKIALEQFNVITPENILKWERVHPKPGVYNFGPADSLIELCQKNNISTILNDRPKKADAMNSVLYTMEIYSKLDQKNVTAWLDLRNKSAVFSTYCVGIPGIRDILVLNHKFLKLWDSSTNI